MKISTLVIDDEPIMLSVLESMLKNWGHEVTVAATGEDALQYILSEPFDLVVSDIRLPNMDGHTLMVKAHEKLPNLPFILVTGHGSIQDAVKAIQDGAFQYLLRPVNPDEFEIIVQRALEDSKIRRQNQYLRSELAGLTPETGGLIGKSASMNAIHDLIDRVAHTDSTVLITGETGTGKEMVAQTVHFRSQRAEGPMVAFNCAAFNENLMESELFGHEKGSFTGATQTRRGRFEDADGGTIFLDEIGETSKEFQAKLLRVLQEREIERVGGNKKIKVDVRIIASTNRDLLLEVKEGRFREDLYYRLRVVPMHIPPLRERQKDIPILATCFLNKYVEQYGCDVKGIDDSGMNFLKAHPWPGNVRELRHTIERAVVLATHQMLTVDDFKMPDIPAPQATTSADSPITLQDIIDKATHDHVLDILDRTDWRKQAAADLLEIDRATLYRTIKKYSISRKDNRTGYIHQ